MPDTVPTSVLAPFNRPHRVDDETADFLFTLYQLLRRAPASMSNHAKKRTFENAADGAHSWRVVCISERALEHVAENGNAQGLRRAHAMPREERFQAIFGPGADEWGRDELMDFFFKNDTCALVTAAENGTDSTDDWSPLHKVPDGILCKGSFSIYARAGVDVPWAQQTLQTIRQPSS